MKKTKYWKVNKEAKRPYEKYTEITEEESKKLTFIEKKESLFFIDKIFK